VSRQGAAWAKTCRRVHGARWTRTHQFKRRSTRGFIRYLWELHRPEREAREAEFERRIAAQRAVILQGLTFDFSYVNDPLSWTDLPVKPLESYTNTGAK
jgi:hypothetical protein